MRRLHLASVLAHAANACLPSIRRLLCMLASDARPECHVANDELSALGAIRDSALRPPRGEGPVRKGLLGCAV